ncbi:MAG: urease accessory protein UreD [Ruegeria sp.]
MQAVLVNTAGGVTGGDRFDLSATARADAYLTLTTQAAERAYRASGPTSGRIRTHLTVDAGGQLNWLPQETILFDGCAIDRRLRVDLAPDASLLLVESLIFGRAAMGEQINSAKFHDRIEIWRTGRLVHLDALRLSGDLAGNMARPGIGGGAGALSSLVLIRPDAAAHLDPIRAALPDTGGVSQVGDDMLLMRLLAPDGFALRQTLVPILNRLTRNSLPRPWMI